MFCAFFIVYVHMVDVYKIPESVLVVIYTANMQVLLIERTGHPGFWQSVTGSKDTVDEAPREAARREVLEETGIAVAVTGQPGDVASGVLPAGNLQDWQLTNVYEIYPVWRHRYAPGVTKNVEHVFGLLVPDTIDVTLSPREHTQYCWKPYRQAADQCFSPSNAEAILQLPRYVT